MLFFAGNQWPGHFERLQDLDHLRLFGYLHPASVAQVFYNLFRIAQFILVIIPIELGSIIS